MLFEASDGCSHVWVVNKVDHSPAFDFMTVAGGVRDEGLTCDNITFAPTNVIWSVGTFEPRQAVALEIPTGTCGSGGLPVPKPVTGHGEIKHNDRNRRITITINNTPSAKVDDSGNGHNDIDNTSKIKNENEIKDENKSESKSDE